MAYKSYFGSGTLFRDSDRFNYVEDDQPEIIEEEKEYNCKGCGSPTMSHYRYCIYCGRENKVTNHNHSQMWLGTRR